MQLQLCRSLAQKPWKRQPNFGPSANPKICNPTHFLYDDGTSHRKSQVGYCSSALSAANHEDDSWARGYRMFFLIACFVCMTFWHCPLFGVS